MAKSTQERVDEIENYFEAFEERMRNATAPAWRPKDGEKVSIEVVQLKRGESGYGKYPIVIGKLMETGAVIAIHAFHTVLRDRLRELQCDIGKRYIIAYLGVNEKNDSKDPDDPDTYHMYYAEEINLDLSENVAKEDGFEF